MKKRFAFVVLLILLILATMACGWKYYGNIRVYAATSGSSDEFYDKSTNKILQDNVWVFRPDGTFSAVVIVDSERKILSGKYNVDNAGYNIYISIDTNGDGEFDDSLYGGKDSSYIEWVRGDIVLKYLLTN